LLVDFCIGDLILQPALQGSCFYNFINEETEF
jgi:hypothetical protein